MKPCLYLLLSGLLPAAQLSAQNNTLHGRVLYQSSGNKPAAGVQIKEQDSNGDYSKDNGDYRLTFQTKRNGAGLSIEIGPDTREGKKIELVNEKEIKAAKLPASTEELLDIIVCPAGQRDIAAQRYYRILRTTADRELERKKKEVEELLAQKEKNYQKISDLFALIDKMQAALDSAKIREQAFNIASINLDRASQMVKDAVKKIEEENDVEGALRILNAEALDTAYEHASALKKKADATIKQVIEGYEFKISLLEPQFKYGEVAECYEKIAGIYEREGYDIGELATNLSLAAYYWGEHGDYQKQLKFNLKALAAKEKAVPINHLNLAVSYNNLATTFGNLGEYQKQLEFNLKVLDTYEKILPMDHSDLARTYNNLGTTYQDLGDYQKQLEFHQKALAIWGKNLPGDHPLLARSYSNLAATYGNLGDYQKQLEFDLKALTIREKVLPADHPDLVESYNNLASSYFNLGDNQKALTLNQKALAIRRKILPADHPFLAITYSNLAATYGKLGEHQKALEFHLKTLAIREKTLPADHPDWATSYNNLAEIYGNLGEYQKSLEFHLKALAIREKNLSAGHPDWAISYNNLAGVYSKLGEHYKALEFNLKALAIQENVLPADHPNLATSYNNLAVSYYYLGESQKALEFNLKALPIYEKSLPAAHPTLAISYSNIGRLYLDTHDYTKSIEYGQKAIRIGESSNPKHPILNRFYYSLGLTYLRAHQYSEAKTAFEKSESLKTEAKVYQGWAMYYSLQNDKIKASENLQKAVDLGYNDLKWITTDESLACIRDWAVYKAIVEQLQRQNPSVENANPATSQNAAALARANISAYQIALDTSLALLAAHEKVLPPGHPDLARLYNNIGYNYAKLRRFPEAKVYFEKFQAINSSGRVFRNWAMYYAMQNDKNRALENLQKAVSLGYNDMKWITTDDSLESIRRERAFKELVEQLKKG